MQLIHYQGVNIQKNWGLPFYILLNERTNYIKGLLPIKAICIKRKYNSLPASNFLYQFSVYYHKLIRLLISINNE